MSRGRDGTVYGIAQEEAAAMPVDRLAIHLLQNMDDETWNTRNWVLERKQWDGLNSADAVSAWEEAWAWLQQQGLVIPNLKQSAAHSVQLSREGRRLRTSESPDAALAAMTARQRLQRDLRTELERARSYFLAGDYEIAAFAAMKEVEVAVRAAGDYPNDLVGVKLMRKAQEDGVLGGHEDDVDSEKQARGHLFAGAIGLFKNPTSHRPVDYEDPAVAAEIIILADLLLRLVTA